MWFANFANVDCLYVSVTNTKTSSPDDRVNSESESNPSPSQVTESVVSVFLTILQKKTFYDLISIYL